MKPVSISTALSWLQTKSRYATVAFVDYGAHVSIYAISDGHRTILGRGPDLEAAIVDAYRRENPDA